MLFGRGGFGLSDSAHCHPPPPGPTVAPRGSAGRLPLRRASRPGRTRADPRQASSARCQRHWWVRRVDATARPWAVRARAGRPRPLDGCLLSRPCFPSGCSVSTQTEERQDGYDDDYCADDVDESVHERSLRVSCRSEPTGPLELQAPVDPIRLGPDTPYDSAHSVRAAGRRRRPRCLRRREAASQAPGEPPASVLSTPTSSRRSVRCRIPRPPGSRGRPGHDGSAAHRACRASAACFRY